jgi:uncharacterized protein
LYLEIYEFLINHLMDLQPLLSQIAAQYRLDPNGTHGLSHWGRVLENGLRLAETEKGDQTVIILFAIFHDACRHNQAVDLGHGKRGAALADKLLTSHPAISSIQLELLKTACTQHTDGKTAGDITIQICWDSDRLDLLRAGIRPSPGRLCTPTAKQKQLIDWANSRALSNHTPDFVQREWMPVFLNQKPRKTT